MKNETTTVNMPHPLCLLQTVVPLWIFKIPKILLRKIPRLNKNSQAILKIGENGDNENKITHLCSQI